MKAVPNKSDAKKRKRDESQDVIVESPKKAKVHAQRKFAQGAAYNSPSVAVIKDKIRPPANVNNPNLVLSAKRPNTEDFLTFLCFRRTSILPSKLDFFKYAYKQQPADCMPKSTISNVVHKSLSTDSNMKQNHKKHEKNDSVKRTQTPVQALRKKYQEQRLAKQNPTNVTKLAQKVKGKNMIRTRSSTLQEEKPKHVEKVNVMKERKPTISGLRSGLLRSPAGASKCQKKNDKSENFKNLRSRVKEKVAAKASAAKAATDRKSAKGTPRETSPKKSETAKSAKCPESTAGKSKDRRANVKRVEGLSDFSSDDNEPLLAVRKAKPIPKGKKLPNGVKEIPRVNNVKTRSQVNDIPTPVVSPSVRPTRKTKEAAAIYMEMITKKLVSPEKSGDDDRSSVDSFPELPNVRRSEQRESEIKAKAMALKKNNVLVGKSGSDSGERDRGTRGDAQKQRNQKSDDADRGRRENSRRNDHFVNGEVPKRVTRESQSRKGIQQELPKRAGRELPKRAVDDVPRKITKEDATKKPSREGIPKKTAREEPRSRASKEDLSRKQVKDDCPRKSTRDETARKDKSARRDSSNKKSARDDVPRKKAEETKRLNNEDSARGSRREETLRKCSREETAKKSNGIEHLKKPPQEDPRRKNVKDEVQRKPTKNDVPRKTVQEDLTKKCSKDDTSKKCLRDRDPSLAQGEMSKNLLEGELPKIFQDVLVKKIVKDEPAEEGTTAEAVAVGVRHEPPGCVTASSSPGDAASNGGNGTDAADEFRKQLLVPKEESADSGGCGEHSESAPIGGTADDAGTNNSSSTSPRSDPSKKVASETVARFQAEQIGQRTNSRQELPPKGDADQISRHKSDERGSIEHAKGVHEDKERLPTESPSTKPQKGEGIKKTTQDNAHGAASGESPRKHSSDPDKSPTEMPKGIRPGSSENVIPCTSVQKWQNREGIRRNEAELPAVKDDALATVERETSKVSHGVELARKLDGEQTKKCNQRRVATDAEKRGSSAKRVDKSDRADADPGVCLTAEETETRSQARCRKPEEPDAKSRKTTDRASGGRRQNPVVRKGSGSGGSVSFNNWLPPSGAAGSSLVEAPTFYPTEKEFQDPLEFFERIRPAAENFGLCRIVPPSTFKPDCKVSDDMRFTAYNQYVHRMFHRWGPNIKEMMAIKKYLATQSISFKQPPWIGGIEVDLPRLYQSVQNCGGLMKVMEKKKWNQVADMMRIPKAAQDRVTKLDDIYCKYLLPYDTLSQDERQKLLDEVESDWIKSQEVTNESDEESEEEFYVDECEECIVKGRNMALNQFYRIARNTMSMWFKTPEPGPSEVENEFWRHVSERNHHVCVHSGSIDSSGWGYGFPVAKNNSFSRHPWNLKVLTNNSGSVLRSLGPVMGVTVPTLHVGMVFTAFCWYRDPHGLPWVEYLHTGAPKIWYGISDDNSSVFKEALTKLLPRYIKNRKIWLPCDTAIVPPALLVEQGVSLCHTVQKPGQFILVFPRAFTSSICTGYLVSESVYFAQPSWLATAEQVFRDIQDCCEPTMFSLEKLLFSIATDSRASVDVLKQVLPMVCHIKQREIDNRKTLYNLGLRTSERLPVRDEGGNKKRKGKLAQDGEGDYECDVCRANLCVSLVINSQEEGVHCLTHAIEFLSQKKHQLKYCKLMYSYTQEELCELTEKLEQRIESKSQKKVQSKSGTK